MDAAYHSAEKSFATGSAGKIFAGRKLDWSRHIGPQDLPRREPSDWWCIPRYNLPSAGENAFRIFQRDNPLVKIDRTNVPAHTVKKFPQKHLGLKQNDLPFSHLTIALRQNTITLEHFTITLRQTKITLPHFTVTLEQNTIALRHLTITLRQNDLPLSQLTITLGQNTITLTQNPITLEQNPLPFWQNPPSGTRLMAGSRFPVKFLEINCPKSEQNPAGNVQPRMDTDGHGFF